MAYKNPWAQQHVERERTYYAESHGEVQVARVEAQYAEDRGSVPCGLCDAPAWYKPSVGTDICTKCGALWASGCNKWVSR